MRDVVRSRNRGTYLGLESDLAGFAVLACLATLACLAGLALSALAAVAATAGAATIPKAASAAMRVRFITVRSIEIELGIEQGRL